MCLNFHFGFLLTISCLFVFSVYFILKIFDLKTYITSLLICALIILFRIIWVSFFKNGYLPGMLLGVVAFPIENFQAVIFLSVVFCYAHVIFDSYNPHEPRNFQLFFLLYTYFLISSIYWLKTNNNDHLLNYLSCNVFSIVVIFYWLINEKRIKVDTSTKKYFILLVCIISSCLASYSFLNSTNDLNNLRAFSKEYQWDIGGANFATNMNPESFSADMNLITRHSFADECLTILSEYDSLFLFLMNKSSCLGQHDLGSTLFNKRSIGLQIERLNKNKPNIIYIAAESPTYIPVKKDYKFGSYDKVYKGRISGYLDKNNSFNMIFHGLSSRYVLIDRGQKINAYRRIED